MDVSEKIILDLPEADLQKAIALATLFRGKIYAVKIHALLDRHGPGIFQQILRAGVLRIFVDDKLSDTPDAVAARVKALRDQGANIITVHAEGGVRMMDAAVRAGAGAVRILAVTVLTSFSHDEVRAHYGETALGKTIQLTKFALEAGVHGVVVSGEEVGTLSKWTPMKGLDLVVPGIRSSNENLGSQRRWVTAADAVRRGATHLVIGREVTEAYDPVAAFAEIERKIREAMYDRDTAHS